MKSRKTKKKLFKLYGSKWKTKIKKKQNETIFLNESNECSRHQSRKLKFNAATLTRIWFDTELSIRCLYRLFIFYLCLHIRISLQSWLFVAAADFLQWRWWWLCFVLIVHYKLLLRERESFGEVYHIEKNLFYDFHMKTIFLCFTVSFLFFCFILRLLNGAARVNHLNGTDNFSFRQPTN